MKTLHSYNSVFKHGKKAYRARYRVFLLRLLLTIIILNHPVSIWKDDICHLSSSNKMKFPINTMQREVILRKSGKPTFEPASLPKC